ncbi:hypothetical protein IV203_025819 [Nitzschia inconspicua]|uniref:AB hydrolase-1 domain-containing protein n=1 Tax=Nitzschia inconspicua TaxID=303405 RepID=A0A9K3LHM9_9STRA|nr:hypothetical protein IV203_017666 [Nitzschia inconspicua]KAG7362153.1 hypothetical protein IV203_025819 [Nitzschia inconspicua]
MPRNNNNNNDRLFSWQTATVIGVTVLLFLYMHSLSQQQRINQPQNVNKQQQQKQQHQQQQQQQGISRMNSIQQGRTETGVEYYHCRPVKDDETKPTQHLILLHGSRFSKEDWKTSGILQQFCSIPGLTVSALDFSVASTHKDFRRLMDESSLFTPPVTAVVTPSASGQIVTEWMTNGHITKMPLYMHTWIPVAVGSVHSTTQTQLQDLKGTGVDILAIYGDQDRVAGHDTSMLLQKWAGATTVELNGGHPCYLDSPDEFVQVIQSHLGLS